MTSLISLEALQHFFTYVVKSNRRERIVFDDYYKPSAVGSFSEPIQIIDPVNQENNVFIQTFRLIPCRFCS